MEDAGGLFVAQAAAAITAAPRLEAYSRDDVSAALSHAADRRAALQAEIDAARHAALQPPMPLDVVPRAAADQALRAAEAKLDALRAELADAQTQLQRAQLTQATLVPLELAPEAWVAPVAPVPSLAPVVTAAEPVAPPAVAWTAPAPVPTAPVAVAPPQVIVAHEPFARATGLLQVVTWSIVVAVVLIVLLAWFA